MVRTLWAGSQVDSVETNGRWAKPISADRMLPVSLDIISQLRRFAQHREFWVVGQSEISD